MDLGRFDEAEEPLRRAVEIRRRTTEAGGVLRLAAELNLASWQSATGEHDSAVRTNRRALSRFLELSGGAPTASTVRVQSLLAESLRRRGGPGDLEEAVALARSVVEVQQEMLASRRITALALADSYTTLGWLELDLGRTRSAAEALRAALESRGGQLPEDNWRVAEVRIGLAQAVLEASVGDDAEFAEIERLIVDSQSAELSDDAYAWLRKRRLEVGRRLSERRRSGRKSKAVSPRH